MVWNVVGRVRDLSPIEVGDLQSNLASAVEMKEGQGSQWPVGVMVGRVERKT